MTKLEFIDKINDILVGLNTLESDLLGSLYDELMRSQWIPVEERLPKEKQKVLVYMPADERCDHEYMCEALYNYVWHKWEDADEPIELEGVTHWMEIQPPKEEE